MEQVAFKIEGIIAVQNHGTSGSTLMQSLLDSHPNILSLPALHGRELYVFWQKFGHLPAIEFLPHFVKAYRFWDSLGIDLFGFHEMGLNRDESIALNIEAFEQALINLGWNATTPLLRHLYIITIFVAHAQAQGRVIDQPNYWLVFPIHGHALNQAIFLAQDFPKVYFLHTVREFIQNMGSHIKHLAKNAAKILPYDSVYLMEATLRQIYLDDGVHMNQLGLHGIHPYVPDSPDGRLQSRAVRLEDMHKDSEATMRSVAGWLGIAWDPVLIKSTYDGKLWNNRKEAIDRSGLGNKTILQKHTEVFNRFDRWRLKQIGRPRFLFYQYAVEKDFAPYWQRRWLIPLLLWIPFKVEWKFPHSRRMRKLLGLPKMDNIIVHVMRWKIKAGDLKKSRLPLFSLVCVYLMIEGMIRTRKYLMEIWRESLIKAPPGFVPLLHYRQDGT